MKPKKDYSFIKGVNYEYQRKNQTEWLSELTMAKRIGINSLRIWLNYSQYKNDPESYIRYIKSFFQFADSLGLSVMPIIFNGNAINQNNAHELDDAFIPDGEKYVNDVVDGLKDEPALLMYDVMNEPGCNHLIWDAKDEAQRTYWMDKHWKFVRYFCAYVKSLDTENAITVGCWLADHICDVAEFVDVLSYHDYSPSDTEILNKADIALAVSKKYGKPVMNTETGCIARGNPYDLTIQLMDERHIPWYIYGLTADGYWNDAHGLFYADGTVRDPAGVAAVMGFYRNRNYNTIIVEKPNREKLVTASLNKLKRLLDDSTNDCFNYQGVSLSALLDECDELANFLEGAQLVPMRIPPTARVYNFRKQENPNALEIKAFAFEMAETLKEACQIL